MNKSIFASAMLGLALVSSAFSGSGKSSYCDTAKKMSCCPGPCCPGPCCPAPKATVKDNNLSKAIAKAISLPTKKSGCCNGGSCCNGGACCATKATKA